MFCLCFIYVMYIQGGIKFEISLEPNFPVNNFAQNNMKKSRHQSENNQHKVVTKNKINQ